MTNKPVRRPTVSRSHRWRQEHLKSSANGGYWDKLSEDEKAWLKKFDLETVQGYFLGRKDEEHCPRDIISSRVERRKLWREIGIARGDVSNGVSRSPVSDSLATQHAISNDLDTSVLDPEEAIISRIDTHRRMERWLKSQKKGNG